ncbi:MAG: hypothetical protein ACMUHM_02825 [Thermoplasmatota archaeon]
MMGLVRLFLLEEVRLRRSFSSSLSLLVFPELVLLGSLAGYIFIPALESSITYTQVHTGILSGLLLFGISMGGIAFLGKEFIERSLGPVNMLAASSSHHPVSERRMYLAYFLHDLLFYLVLILFPMTLGLLIGTIVHPMPAERFLIITAAHWSTFLLGLSLSLIISSILSGRRGWQLLILPVLIMPLFAVQLITGEISGFIPSVLSVNGGSQFWILLTILLSSLYTAGGVFLYKNSESIRSNEVAGSYLRARKFTSHLTKGPIMSSLLAREWINFVRGQAYVRVGFSLLLPLVVMGGLVGLIEGLDDNMIDFNLPFFAIMASFFTMSIYTHIVNMDYLEFDQTLPVRTSDMIKVKIRFFLVLGLPATLVFLSVAAVIKGDLVGLLYSIPMVLIMVPYIGCVTGYLTGLWTNSMLFDASVFIRYLALTVLPLMMATLLSFLMESIFVVSLIGLGLITVSGLVSTMFLYNALEEKWSDAVLQSAGGA